MARYRVFGTDRESGLNTRLMIEAATPDEAANRAMERGVVGPVVEGQVREPAS